jgi:hypothetical protein
MRFAQVGRYNRNVYTGYDDIEIEREYMHPDFGSDASQISGHDQMLLKLKRSTDRPAVTVNLNPGIPSTQGEEITVIGLGRLGETQQSAQILQQVTVGYVPNQFCKNTDSSYRQILTDDMICITGENNNREEGQCYGDSGGL